MNTKGKKECVIGKKIYRIRKNSMNNINNQKSLSYSGCGDPGHGLLTWSRKPQKNLQSKTLLWATWAKEKLLEKSSVVFEFTTTTKNVHSCVSRFVKKKNQYKTDKRDPHKETAALSHWAYLKQQCRFQIVQFVVEWHSLPSF